MSLSIITLFLFLVFLLLFLLFLIRVPVLCFHFGLCSCRRSCCGLLGLFLGLLFLLLVLLLFLRVGLSTVLGGRLPLSLLPTLLLAVLCLDLNLGVTRGCCRLGLDVVV